MKEKFDCRTCGACCVCFGDQEVFCDVTEEDTKRLSKQFLEKSCTTEFPMNTLYVAIKGLSEPYSLIKTRWRRMKSGPLKGYEMNVCVALRGSVMGRTSCSIYKNRPNTCKEAVKPGTRGCKEVRRALKRAIDNLKEEKV